jgi:(2Fe-2S) ferredoxin
MLLYFILNLTPSVQRFDFHIFICINERAPDDPKGCCAAKGSKAIADKFKEELHRRGLKGKVRANKAGCLDACERGPSVVVYPDGVWYQRVTVEDVNEIIESHILGGKPVERLRVPITDWRKPSNT